MSVIDHAGSAQPEPAGVRVCGSCARPVAARDKSEYTAARARLLIDRGLCICPVPPADEQSPAKGIHAGDLRPPAQP